MSEFSEFQTDATETPQGGLTQFVQKMSTRKRPLIVGIVVLVVLVVAFLLFTPRTQASSTEVQAKPQVAERSEQAWTPSPEPSATSRESQSDADPDELVDYVRKAVETASGDQQINMLWTRLGIEKGSPLAIAQTARNGDFALVTVVGVRSTGEVIKVQCELQRDANAWRIREVQSTS